MIVKFTKDGHEFTREMPSVPQQGDRITFVRPEGSWTVIVHHVEWQFAETETTIVIHCVNGAGEPAAPMRFVRDEAPCGICGLPPNQHIAPEGLYMTTETPFIPVINNCSVEVGLDPTDCQMCKGHCPGRHAWVP